MSAAQAIGDRVTDDRGRAVQSQRLSNGDLAFLARDVPPLGAKRCRLVPQAAQTGGAASERAASGKGAVVADAAHATLTGNSFSIALDATTGAIRTLTSSGTSPTPRVP